MRPVLPQPAKWVKTLAQKIAPVYHLLLKQRDCRITKEQLPVWYWQQAGFHAYVPIKSLRIEEYPLLSNALIALTTKLYGKDDNDQSTKPNITIKVCYTPAAILQNSVHMHNIIIYSC